jgi:hypothetical protein
MCDYSLHNVTSRPANVGDRLLTTGFAGTSTRGFAAIGEPAVAVCVLPGTEIAFMSEVERKRFFGAFRRERLHGTLARFRQVNTNDPTRHHDAIEFPDGHIVLRTQLRNGQEATVLQLPAPSQDVPQVQQREADFLRVG